MRKLCLLLAVLAGSLQAQALKASAPSALDKPTLEQYVRNLYVFGPDFQVKVGDPTPSAALPGFRDVHVIVTRGPGTLDQLLYVAPDGKHFVQGNVFDIAVDPFAADRDKLKTEFQPSFGTPGAPVVIVEFTDFQCPYCREEAKLLRQNLLTSFPKEVRLYFKDYPLEQLHPWAKTAAMAGRCIFRQNPNAFWEYHDYIFENQAAITADNLREKINAFAQGKAFDAPQLNRCLELKSTEGDINKSIAEARALNLDSTPTLFVNGRKLGGAQNWDTLKRVIDFELQRAKAAGTSAEEACCSTKLPVVGGPK